MKLPLYPPQWRSSSRCLFPIFSLLILFFVQIRSRLLRFLGFDFSKHTLDYVHGKVNLGPLDIETGHEADGIFTSGEEENAPESCGVDNVGGERSVVEGDAAYEAATTNGGGNERGEVGGKGGQACVEVVCDGGDVGLEGWGG